MSEEYEKRVKRRRWLVRKGTEVVRSGQESFEGLVRLVFQVNKDYKLVLLTRS